MMFSETLTRKKISSILLSILFIMLMTLSSISTSFAAEVVPDENLRRVINEKLGNGAVTTPISISDLQGLTGTLNASDKDISSVEGLQHATGLSKLKLSKNNISDISQLSALTSLTELSLGFNNISDISHLSALTSLKKLTMSRNEIADISSLNNLKNLTKLTLSYNKITNIDTLAGLPKLKELYLGSNDISNFSPLSNLTTLTKLSLFSSKIDDLSFLTELKSLTYLKLNDNNISDLSNLSGLKNIKKLYLNNNKISDVSNLSGLTNLVDLNLNENQIMDISSLSSITPNKFTCKDQIVEKEISSPYIFTSPIIDRDSSSVGLNPTDSGSVDNGDGTYTLNAQSSILSWDNNSKFTGKLKVKRILTIESSAGPNGSIDPLGSVVVAVGDNQTFTITPDAGYHIKDVLVDGVSVGNGDTYTFKDINANHKIEALFEKDAANYIIESSAGDNGSISPSGNVTVTEGDSKTFTITPDTGYHIKDVLVDGVSVGSGDTYTFEDINDNHKIEALFEKTIVNYIIESSAGDNGSISPSGDVTVAEGESKTFTITPDTGYHIKDVLVDGVSVGSGDTYTFEDINANHKIEALFEKTIVNYTIESSAGDNGNISPSGDVTVAEGDSKTFTITPDAGYHIKDVLVDGVSVGNGDTYTFKDINANHKIEALFEKTIVNYTIESSAGDNGSISPSGDVTVSEGDSKTFTITPDTGYHIKDVLVDGVSVGSGDTYTFKDVNANHKIEVVFEKDIYIYTIKSSVSGDGSISPSGDISALEGKDKKFVITPDAGYHIKDVLVDGVSVGAVNTYTFTNVSSNHKIQAIFEKDIIDRVDPEKEENPELPETGDNSKSLHYKVFGFLYVSILLLFFYEEKEKSLV